MPVLHASNVRFRDGYPSSGTDFGFFKNADTALKFYLTQANACTNINYLITYLGVVGGVGVTIYDHFLQQRPIATTGQRDYPLVYIASWLRGVGHRAGGIVVAARTRVLIWTQMPNPEDSQAQSSAVTGAIASIIKQSAFGDNAEKYSDASAAEWKTWFANEYPNDNLNDVEGIEPQMEVDAEGRYTGQVRSGLFVNWYHWEQA